MNKAADTTKSVHLSASAGSGKTRALKDRYLALLDRLDRSGLNIDQAVAITFTDKAAAEIKERVMRDLPEVMLKKIIRGSQDLRISTIHSFCMNLLKRYPLEAGLPPDFGVLDSRDQTYKVRKAIEDTLESSDRDQEIMAVLSGFTSDDLIGTVGFLLSVRSRLKRIEIDAGGPEGLINSIRAGMEIGAYEAELKALTAGFECRASFLQMERILRLQGDFYDTCMGAEHLRMGEAAEAGTALGILRSLSPVYFNKDGTPRKNPSLAKKNYQGQDRAEYEKSFFSIQALLYRLRNAYQRFHAGLESISMLQLYLRAEAQYQRSKLREGLLDFDDLEIYAYRLLQNASSPDILYWLDRKILHFLVDEFQDTSDIQWAILDKLTSEIFAGQGADKRMPPTLFVVGDTKQSIYRFREANYRLLENVKRKMEENLPSESREVLTLDKNFRSTTEVIGTVNRVFSCLWGERYQPSEADRAGHCGSARLIEIPPADPGAARSNPSEADVLAGKIRSLVETGALVFEKTGDTWKERPASFDDCAILIQSRTKLKEYEAALHQAGVRFRVVGGIGFYEEDEIQALVSILFFLWNKDDRLSLAAALKSPLFGLTDKDIFDLVEAGGAMPDALRMQKPGAWELLHSWQMIAGLVPLAKLLHTVISDTGAYVRFGGKNSQAIFNIDKLLDTAREFDRKGYSTLQDFVEWIRNIRETEQREATADMNLPGVQGSVSILTVHKAKGLEYPIVFLPGMNQEARSLSHGPGALISEENGVHLALKGPDNPVYDDLWKGENGEQEDLRREHQRLFYVAMTRARDHLFMLGTLANNKAAVKQNTWLDYLHRAIGPPQDIGKGADRISEYAYPDWQAQEGPTYTQAGPRAAGTEHNIGINAQVVLGNLSPLPRSETPEWKRATDFISQETESPVPGGATAVSPLLRGTVCHRCLELFTKTGAYDLDAVVGEHPEILALGNDEVRNFKNDTLAILGTVLNNAAYAWIFEQGDSAYSELPFLYKKEHALISGIIDRVVIKNNAGFVIDYKAILIENDDALAAWQDHYRPQVAVYCEAVKEIFRLERVEGYLLFLDSNRLVHVV